VVVIADAPPNKLGVDEGAEEAGGLLRPEKRFPPAAGVVEVAVEFGVPKICQQAELMTKVVM